MEHLTMHMSIHFTVSQIAGVFESFLLLAPQVNNLRCCFLWNILSSLHLLPS